MSCNQEAFVMPQGESTFAKRVRSEMSDPAKVEVFAALKQNLRDVWVDDFNDDIYLYRFFKARQFDRVRTEEMIRNHLRWRKEYKADDLLANGGFQEAEVITRYYAGGFCGVDKEGHPVWYEPSGLIDPQGLARSVTREHLLRSRIYITERFVRQILPEMRRKTGLPLYSCTFVIDLTNYGRRHLWGPGLEFYAEFVQICEQNYPETIGTAYIVNAPAIFPIVFNLLKPLLHVETQKKIKVLGRNYKQILLNAIDADELPKIFGGNRTDPDGDPHCRSMICWGGDVPKHYYLKPNYPERLVSQSIGRRSTHRVELSVPPAPQAGQWCIEWDFLTDDGDLGFEIVSTDDSESEPLVGYRRVHCGICPCSGAVACPQSADSRKYTVCFDNAFSRIRSKRLRYFVHVTDKPIAALMDTDSCRTAADLAAGADPGPKPSNETWKSLSARRSRTALLGAIDVQIRAIRQPSYFFQTFCNNYLPTWSNMHV
ncbi:hypothetical protein BOX15_Mlig014551g2 [Macrostomum lignano]|uniref:CRAL-TRIO domain-containing protein n=1 Tax=Macrostomum lignano TaxID=282301 RepID=A0A267EFB1_9PLAT|nr:hypothetical protein BOX15_Mlig014551g2 [Macrostomum lignano]